MQSLLERAIQYQTQTDFNTKTLKQRETHCNKPN